MCDLAGADLFGIAAYWRHQQCETISLIMGKNTIGFRRSPGYKPQLIAGYLNRGLGPLLT